MKYFRQNQTSILFGCYRALIHNVIIVMIFVIVSVLPIHGQSPSFQTFMNPVIPGDHPDPNLFRDGDDYFTTGSAFNTTAVIYHSTDMVHWEVCGRPADPGWEELDDCPACGIWGGCLAHFAGYYWDYFALKGSMWFVKADSPFGPWSTPVKMSVPSQALNGLGIDNSIFVDDDGTAYLVAKPGRDKNQIFKLNAEGQCTGEKIDLGWINPAPAYPFSWAEGPVMCKKDGYYYYFVAGNAAGGEYAFRSLTLTGEKQAWEYLGDIFSTEDHSSSLFYGPNHCSYPVQTDNGTWWSIVQSGEFTWTNDEWQGQGRQGLLSRVAWTESGIPVMTWPVNYPLTAPNLPSGGIPWMVPKSDFFTEDHLNVEWEFLGRTPTSMYSVTDRPGWLRIKPGARLKHMIKNDGEHAYSLITRVDFDPQGSGDQAGIRITNGLDGENNRNARLFSTLSNGKKVICLTFDNVKYEVENTAGNIVWLRLIRSGHLLSGFYSSGGSDWIAVGGPINVSGMDKGQPDNNGWIGNRQGLFAQNRTADFDLYIYRDAYSKIEANCPANRYGTAMPVTDNGNPVLGNIHDGDWALYAGVEFGNDDYIKTPSRIEIEAASVSEGGVIEVWMDSIDTGTKATECLITNTGAPDQFGTFSSAMDEVRGRHDVYLRFKGSAAGELFRIRSFHFEAKKASGYSYAKIEEEPSVIFLYLSEPVLISGPVTGLQVKINETVKDSIIDIAISEEDDKLVVIFLKNAVLNTDEVSISYTGGTVLTPDGAALLPFSDEIVDNLLPGSPPRLITARTYLDGDSLELIFNKEMVTASALAADFAVNIGEGGMRRVGVILVTTGNAGPASLLLVPEETLYAEYAITVGYSGTNLVSPDSGYLVPFEGFTVLNRARGTPPSILSSSVHEDGFGISLEFSKNLRKAEDQAKFFLLKLNDVDIPIYAVAFEDTILSLSMGTPIRFDDEILISYSGTAIESFDAGILEDFTDFHVDNTLAEPDFHIIPGIVEAEDFVTNSGTYPQNTSDESGGKDIGWIDSGDYLDYAVDVEETGLYTIGVRVTTPYSGSRIIWQNPGPETRNLDTIAIPVTGDWQSWRTVYSIAEFDEGRQYLRMLAKEGGFRVNRYSFEKGNTIPYASIVNIATDRYGNSIEISYDKPLKYPANDPGSFTILIDNEEVVVKSLALKAGDQNTLVLALAGTLLNSGSRLTISYSGDKLMSSDNIPLPTFHNIAIDLRNAIKDTKTNSRSLNIFPNPASHSITIEADFPFDRLVITDLAGRVIMSKETNSFQHTLILDIAFPAGAYLLNLAGKNKKSASGFIVR